MGVDEDTDRVDRSAGGKSAVTVALALCVVAGALTADEELAWRTVVDADAALHDSNRSADDRGVHRRIRLMVDDAGGSDQCQIAFFRSYTHTHTSADRLRCCSASGLASQVCVVRTMPRAHAKNVRLEENHVHSLIYE